MNFKINYNLLGVYAERVLRFYYCNAAAGSVCGASRVSRASNMSYYVDLNIFYTRKPQKRALLEYIDTEYFEEIHIYTDACKKHTHPYTSVSAVMVPAALHNVPVYTQYIPKPFPGKTTNVAKPRLKDKISSYVKQHIHKKCKIPNSYTTDQAEALAILLALEMINRTTGATDNNSDTGTKYVIFSDSLNVIRSLKNYKIDNKFTKAIIDNCFQLNITFCWIPSHMGIKGNKAANYLAKQFKHTNFRDFTEYFP